MRPYIGIFRDDHRVYGEDEKDVDYKIRRYLAAHPKQGPVRKFKIPRVAYRDYLRGHNNKLWWIVRQGDPMNELSPGRKQLIANMFIGNIPSGLGNIRRRQIRAARR